MNYVLIGLLCLISTACSINHAQIAVHDLGLPMAVDGFNPSPKINIRVEAPEWLQDNRIRYRLLYASPTQVRFYSLDRWIAMPSQLFEQQLLASVKPASGQKGIAHPTPLIIRLLEFEQQFNAPDKAKVVLGFSIEAYAADNKTVISTQIMRLEQLSLTPDAKGAVNGLARLTQQAVDKIGLFNSIGQSKKQ